MDVFDGIPDPVVVDILNKIGDVKTLLRCSSVSKRFNSLVPQSESLFLPLEQIRTPEPDSELNSPVACFFQSLFKPFHGIFPLFSKSSKQTAAVPVSPTIPAKILSRFDQIRNLDVELSGGDVKLEKDANIKWKAEFGKSLKSCVIVTFRSATVSASATEETDADFVTGLKKRVVWTISALMAASTRHHLMSDVVKQHKEMESLVIRDRESEGTVVMDAEGLREFRKTEAREEDDGEERVAKGRTIVPSVRMSMRHAPLLKLKSGICLESATLVVVRPSGEVSDVKDAELATEAFPGGCMYGEAVVALLKCKKNALEMEMNSF